MIRNKVKLPKQLESLENKRRMMEELLSSIDKEIDIEYVKLTDNISERNNGKSFSLLYNGITFNFKPLKGYDNYTVIKSGRPTGGVYNKNKDALKLDIVKGLL
jgi:hypothetical protein